MQDFEELDYYTLLGVERIASSDEIKRAYRQQIMRYHPDRFVGASSQEQEYARERAQRINQAYAVLSDFAARSAYNRERGDKGKRGVPTSVATPAPTPRDHQAEMYDQARVHVDAGRDLQAIALLRQLQQVNPFYRDSASLLAAAEARVQSGRSQRHESSSSTREGVVRSTTATSSAEETEQAKHPSRRLVIGGAIGAALALLTAAALGLRGRANGAIDRSASPVTGISSAPQSFASPVALAPTTAATVASTLVSSVASSVTAELAPTLTAVPASTATLLPSAVPSATVLAVPTAIQETGALLGADSFNNTGTGWASIQNQFWGVGYADGRYRINVEPGVGNIWSYRTVPGGANYSVGVDVSAQGGSAGLLVRYVDRFNYLVCMLSPDQGTYRIQLDNAGRLITIAEGQANALDRTSDASNRLVVRVQDNTVTMLVNGALVAEKTISRLPQTRLYGLVAVSDGASTTAFFDNLEIHDLQ